MRIRARSILTSSLVTALIAATTIAPVPAQSPGASGSDDGVAPTGASMVADRYDVGGRSLFLVCVGPIDSTAPTAIGEAGLGGDSGTFEQLVPLLARAPFRSCAYDRAGQGNSDPPSDGADPGPGPVTLEDGVRDLHALLAAADVRPPYVLVAHSLGGWYARAFTAEHPDEVAGIVFIDSSHPDQAARLRAVLPPARADEDQRISSAREAAASLSAPPVAGTGWLDLVASADQARATGDLGDRPVVVLTHDGPLGSLPQPYSSREAVTWLGMQNELASLSTRGVQRTVPGAGHAIQEDDPEAVFQAILDVQGAIAAGPGAWPGGSPAPEQTIG